MRGLQEWGSGLTHEHLLRRIGSSYSPPLRIPIFILTSDCVAYERCLNQACANPREPFFPREGPEKASRQVDLQEAAVITEFSLTTFHAREASNFFFRGIALLNITAGYDHWAGRPSKYSGQGTATRTVLMGIEE
jgi:hypothetical protein